MQHTTAPAQKSSEQVGNIDPGSSVGEALEDSVDARPGRRERDVVAGYSGAPLERKLGIKEGTRVAVVAAPNGFADSLDLPKSVALRQHARGRLDVIVFFVTRRAELVRRFPALKRSLEPDGGLWIAWPKQTSGIATDLSQNPVREIGLHNLLVDNKVCAIDEEWSGLRFVYRVADRPRS